MSATVKEFGSLEQFDRSAVSRRSSESLESLLRYAFDNVAHYRETLSRRGVTSSSSLHAEDLARFPMLGRDVIRDGVQTGKLLARGVSWRRRVRTQTTGSTGMPLMFYGDTRSRRTRREAWRLLDRWAGIQHGDERVWMTVPRPRPSWSPYQPLTTLRKMIRFRQPPDLISIYKLTAEDVPDIVTALRAKLEPYYIYGMASSIHFIAARALAEGLGPPRPPRVVIGTADSFGSRQRDTVSEFLGCSAYSRYGTFENGGAVAQTCPDNPQVQHVMSELVIAEVVDDDLQPVAPGECGRVLLTDLTNRVMPLIRYDVGDRATAAEGCSCGRPWPVLGEVFGRTADDIVLDDGTTLPVVHLEVTLFYYTSDLTRDISEWQFVQSGPGEIALRFVSEKPLDRRQAEGIREALVGALHNKAHVELLRVERIGTDESGKRRQVVQGNKDEQVVGGLPTSRTASEA